jgi:hypothetical protein
LSAIFWKYIRNPMLSVWKGKWYMQVHSHFNYVNLYNLQVASRYMKNILQNLRLTKMEYPTSNTFDQNMQSFRSLLLEVFKIML